MKTLVIYDAKTGQIAQTMRPAPIGDIPKGLVPPGMSAIRTAQKISGKTHHVRAGKITPKPRKDQAAEATASAWSDLRAQRAAMLMSKVDAINAVRWELMTEAERQAWRDYRQALLDLPQNTPDPRNPKWPEAPE